MAKTLVDRGYDTKEKLSAWLQKNSALTVGDAKNMLFTGGAALRGPRGAELKDDLTPHWPSPSMINVVVVGGQTNPYCQVPT